MPIAAAETRDLAHDEAQDFVWTLNFGPQHPATHTTLRIVLKLDGERVIDAMPDIGYLHSGFEKIGEHLDYNQYVTVTDRMNYISPGQQWLAPGRRKLLGSMPPRCQYLR
jgi:NADH-quinone oxidoreductase subunit D